jgi:DNA-binding GntR family transcriptional regulator
LPLNELVYRQIKSLILIGQLVSGDKVKESVLAKKLNVSRGPVREANQRLIESGFLMSDAQRGIFVKSIPVDELEGLFKIRKCLSPLIADEIFDGIDGKNISKLREVFSVLKQINLQNYDDKNYKYGLRFMGRFMTLTENPKLMSLYYELMQKEKVFNFGQLKELYGFINVTEYNKCVMFDKIEYYDQLLSSLLDKDRNRLIETLNDIADRARFRTQHPKFHYSPIITRI